MTLEMTKELLALDTEDFSLQAKEMFSDLLISTGQLIVNSEESYKKLSERYAETREWQKVLETRRKQLIEPFRKEVVRINDRAKEMSEILDRIIDLANAKTNDYQKLLEKEKKEADEKLREAASLFDAEDSLYIPPLAHIIRGNGAIAVTKTEKKFKVTDLSKVPLKYLQLDERAVEQDIKLGIDKIPGIEIFEETKTTLRIR